MESMMHPTFEAAMRSYEAQQLTPRQRAIEKEILAELERQGFVQRNLEIGGWIDTKKLARAIDVLLHA
jgi:hypothetical protein